jgi:hypothetical protein
VPKENARVIWWEGKSWNPNHEEILFVPQDTDFPDYHSENIYKLLSQCTSEKCSIALWNLNEAYLLRIIDQACRKIETENGVHEKVALLIIGTSAFKADYVAILRSCIDFKFIATD